jgi:hypothetical protein
MTEFIALLRILLTLPSKFIGVPQENGGIGFGKYRRQCGLKGHETLRFG